MVAPRVDAIAIGGSAGSVAALEAILPKLPATSPPVLVVVHVLPTMPPLLAELFGPQCAMRVVEAEPGAIIERGVVYFAPADYHFLVEPDRRCALSVEPPLHFSRPSIDVLFESAAVAYERTLAAVVLTGASDDGARGLAAVARAGGMTFVQDPETAEYRTMPAAALMAAKNARSLPLAALADQLASFGDSP
jgi:two-component system chemotaxis response regulator CheB